MKNVEKLERNKINCTLSYILPPWYLFRTKFRLLFTYRLPSQSIRFLFASEIYGYHWCTIFLLEIMLQTSCNRIWAEMFAERFPDNATRDDILIGYCALPCTIRMFVRFPTWCKSDYSQHSRRLWNSFCTYIWLNFNYNIYVYKIYMYN